jgi:hypothetical protein
VSACVCELIVECNWVLFGSRENEEFGRKVLFFPFSIVFVVER